MDTGGEKTSARKLSRIERRLKVTKEALTVLGEDHDDVSLLEQYQEQMDDIKRELSAIYEEFVAIDLPDDHILITQHTDLEKLHFNCSHLQ